MLHLFCIIFLALPYTFAFPRPPSKAIMTSDDMKFAENYLEKFYLSNAKSRVSMSERLKEMQTFFGMEVTGTLDSETMDIMKKPRCGMPDVAEFSLFTGRPSWSKTTLTYRILSYTPDLPVAAVNEAIQMAFNVWSNVTPLQFNMVSRGQADIFIQFGARNHGDSLAFDGSGRVLAHAYAPGNGLGGDAHFDEDERWSTSNLGVNLFLVAAHEFGHSLGLSHSNVQGALMFPTYSFVDPRRFRLSQDDIDGIQSIYGRRQ